MYFKKSAVVHSQCVAIAAREQKELSILFQHTMYLVQATVNNTCTSFVVILVCKHYIRTYMHVYYNPRKRVVELAGFTFKRRHSFSSQLTSLALSLSFSPPFFLSLSIGGIQSVLKGSNKSLSFFCLSFFLFSVS